MRTKNFWKLYFTFFLPRRPCHHPERNWWPSQNPAWASARHPLLKASRVNVRWRRPWRGCGSKLPADTTATVTAPTGTRRWKKPSARALWITIGKLGIEASTTPPAATWDWDAMTALATWTTPSTQPFTPPTCQWRDQTSARGTWTVKIFIIIICNNYAVWFLIQFCLDCCLDRCPSSPVDVESPALPMVSSPSAPSPDPLPPPLPLPLNLTFAGNGQDIEEFVPVRTKEVNFW